MPEDVTLTPVALEGVFGQREQDLALVLQRIGDAHGRVARAGTRMPEAVAPLEELRVEVADVAEGARGEEALAQGPEAACIAEGRKGTAPSRHRPGRQVAGAPAGAIGELGACKGATCTVTTLLDEILEAASATR